MKIKEAHKLLTSWKTVAGFVYTDEATEEALKMLIDTEREHLGRPSVLTLLYQRYSTKRRERELDEIFGEVKDDA